MITFREIQEEIELEQEEIIEAAPPPDDGQQQIDPMVMKQKASEFVARCFAARNAMHQFHLITQSYAGHKASQKFYEDIIPLADDFAECIAGRIGKFDNFPVVNEKSPDGLTVIGNLTKYIDAIRQIFPFSEIQNIIDSILHLCNSTAYKLRDLR